MNIKISYEAIWHMANLIQNAIDRPDSKVHGANMGPTLALSSPGGCHVGPMNLAMWEDMQYNPYHNGLKQTEFNISMQKSKLYITAHIKLSYIIVTVNLR